MRASFLALFAGAVIALAGCGDDGGSTGAAFQELVDQGLTKYVGQFSPADSQEADGVTTHAFAVPSDPAAEPRGPLCLRGTEFTVDTREGSSDALVIYLQGGGACWDSFCSAVPATNSLPPTGILNPDLTGNPVADWDVLYLPYCDGSLFAGDVDRVLPKSPPPLEDGGDPEQGYQRGLQNLTAALDIGFAEFPNPSRILLTGISGGGFGTIAALPLVRYYYPDTEIVVFNDSGVGVAKEGDPDFVNDTLLAGWNATSLVPESCPECTSNGHVTRLIEWQLAQDDNFTMSALSFSADSVISTFFLMIPAAQFTQSLLNETGRTTMLYEDRYKRGIAEGSGHTFLLTEMAEPDGGGLDTVIAGTSVLEWFTAHIDGTEDWVDLVDEGL